jgi:predicted RNA-binding protein with EMAP domain
VHVAERKMMKIEKLKKEVQTVKYRYMDVKQSIHYTSMPSVIEKKVLEKGLRQSNKAPMVLKLNKS